VYKFQIKCLITKYQIRIIMKTKNITTSLPHHWWKPHNLKSVLLYIYYNIVIVYLWIKYNWMKCFWLAADNRKSEFGLALEKRWIAQQYKFTITFTTLGSNNFMITQVAGKRSSLKYIKKLIIETYQFQKI